MIDFVNKKWFANFGLLLSFLLKKRSLVWFFVKSAHHFYQLPIIIRMIISVQVKMLINFFNLQSVEYLCVTGNS